MQAFLDALSSFIKNIFRKTEKRIGWRLPDLCDRDRLLCED